jgi:type II secretory pathway predicted ATPase ExeA
MDNLANPFSPGAGSPPPELAGRDDLLQQALTTLARVKQGRAEKSMLMVGLRGTGKTVLLNKIETLAIEQGYKVAMVEANEKKPFSVLLLPELRRILFALDQQGVSHKVKRAFRILKSFLTALKLTIKIADIDLGLGVEAEKGSADSGDLEIDMTDLFVALGEAAQERETAIAIIIDELQYLSEDELSALIMAAHKISQKSLPIVIFGAGLPQLVGKAGRAKSYAERLFDYPEIGALNPKDARSALQNAVQKEGIAFTDEALDEIINKTHGYPYFLQEWGYHAWNSAAHSPINTDDVIQATDKAIKQLDQSFFRVRFDRLTPREKQYLHALAVLGGEAQRSGDVAGQMGIEIQQAAPLRNNLIKKGMIYSPKHGDTAFTVPLFESFMKRTMLLPPIL